MKTKFILAISAASLVLTGAIHLHSQADTRSGKTTSYRAAFAARTAERRAERKVAAELRDRESNRENGHSPETAEAANLAGWQSRFEALLAMHGNRDEAVRVLLTEVDAVFSNWVHDQITPLAELPAGERYDRLAEIEISVQEGAAAVLEQIEIEGSRRVTVAAGALEAVAAEIQYAEAAPDPASRLAMLRLDRERESRLGTVLATADETVKTRAMGELEAWYEAGLEKIFPPGEL